MLGWPYRKIARWLVDEHQLQVSWVAVRKFCLVRHIEKGIGETNSKAEATAAPEQDLFAVPANPLVKRRQPSSKVFDYVDDGRPLQTRRTRDLSQSDEETEC